MKTIEILIHPSGQLTIDAAGYQGADCEKATAFLEQALGQLAAKQRKPEWYRRAVRQRHQEVGA
jgi:hypothetical protein